MIQHFYSFAKEISDSDIKIETFHIYGTSDERITYSDADIMIAHGITYGALKQSYPHKYHVEIMTTSFDILDAVTKARKLWNGEKIALCVHNETMDGMDDLESLLGVPVELFDVQNEENIEYAIKEGRQRGAEVFIGGLTLCHRCEELGLSYIHIATSEHAVERALNEAVNTARAVNLERTKINMIQAVLNNAPDAIISVSRQGRVMEVNNQARLVFGIPSSQNCIGEDIRTICPETDWENVMKTGMESEILQSFNGKLNLISCKPIMADGQATGVLVYVQNAEQIRAKETKIRRELSAKGLTAKYSFQNIIGNSNLMKYNIEIAKKYSQVDSNVLLVGETGTGKELFAHSIHNASRRCNQPFVAVNCAALPENLLESELFGYVEGAFSGASKGGKTGLFELAHKGTIFLDEIGELPIDLQAKLLRVLQEKEIRKVGDNKVQSIDVRVISATNINIEERIAARKFRADLYYRLDLLEIEIPPLRERKEDVNCLVDYFLNSIACEQGKAVPIISLEAERVMQSYTWPGNTRELKNFCERLIVLSENSVISGEAIKRLGMFQNTHPKNIVQESDMDDEIYRLLTQKQMKKDEIAKLLGISRTTLWRKLKTK